MDSYQIIQFYCGRGRMENFIKEGKSGFDFAAVSNHSKVVNANRMRLHMLAYNLFNWFRRLAVQLEWQLLTYLDSSKSLNRIPGRKSAHFCG